MQIALLIIIGLLLLFIAWQQHQHELWAARALAHISSPELAACCHLLDVVERELPPLMFDDMFPEQPFELQQRPSRPPPSNDARIRFAALNRKAEALMGTETI